ncbi:Sec-independent protein secretion pathway component TatC [Archaeoglobus sulfaticallidus PM70-1]|uniref:Sec-independent protein translocase protein TatC n=1 Tax=Archaeoglobus sulfaticallidus PM70-1 TaxID=387631 RepID=N0BFL6_9EURY|nr:twin-arginine translocase subunit TatC [Archaeoglobus sulfaticallidus]AGK61823.1 Sec-independent protein secretion pathway component TatC [Archaeoglobus sulfaticallidus PM70-1]
MADFTATEMAEILLMIRNRFMRLVAIIAVTWALTYMFIADTIISKIKTDLLPEGANLIYTAPLEGLILKLKISLYIGIIAGTPYLVYLIYKALKTRTELLENINLTKSSAIKYLIVAIMLFTLGIAYGYMIMLPIFMQFLYSSAASQGVLATYSLAEFINFIILMLAVFGLVFQMPLIMLFLVGNDLVEYRTITYYRKHFYVAFFIIGAAITPPDVFTQAMVAFPMILFFEISILFIRIVYRNSL